MKNLGLTLLLILVLGALLFALSVEPKSAEIDTSEEIGL